MKKIFFLVMAISATQLTACSSPQKRQYISGCTQETGMSEEFCKCIFDKTTDKYSNAELEAINKTGYEPPDFVALQRKLVKECKAEEGAAK